MFELLKSRRSIRKFQEREVEKEKIDTILKSTLLSPSSRSRKPWEFVVVTDKELLGKLSVCREHGAHFLANAPVGIVVIADPAKCDVWIEDASITAIVMQLAAQSLGLGSCWIQVRERFHIENEKAEEYIKRVLNIPERFCVECIITIGYAAEEKKPYNEDDLSFDKVHYNGFGS